MHVSEYHRLLFASSTKEQLKEHTKQYLFSHCFQPQKIKIFDSYLQQFREIEVDCGYCAHCRARKTNEWVTRLYAHSESYKYVYFVTLTYRSVYTLDPVSVFYLDKFKDAIWHYDSFNETGRACYRPCLLIKKHYQDFLKRLRKNTGVQFTYFMSGEYGHKFGSPHWHFIFFSNDPISKDDINRAWSCCVYDSQGIIKRSRNESERSFYISFGKVDYHDLVANGSFNTATPKGMSDIERNSSITNNVKNCFSYVAKYLCKREFNDSRIKLFLNSFKIVDYSEHIDTFHDVCKGSFKLDIQTKQLQDYLSFQFVNHNIYSQNLSIYESFNYLSCFFGNTELAFSQDRSTLLRSFKRVFAPFTCMSRGVPIGSLYFKAHAQEFLEGRFEKPALQTEGFVAPRYFFRKAKEFVFGYRRFSSRAKTPTFVKDNLQAIYSDFVDICNGNSPKYCAIVPEERIDYVKLLNSRFAFKDLNTGERILFKYTQRLFKTRKIEVLYFKYNRVSRSWDFVRSASPISFIEDWLQRFDSSYHQHIYELEIKEKETRLRKECFGRIENLMQEHNAYKDIMLDAYEDIDAHLQTLQELYDARHTYLG